MRFQSAIIILVMVFAATSVMAASKVAVIPLYGSKKLKNIVTVSPQGGDFNDPVAAMASITDSSEDNPYQLVIGPGVYTLTQTLEVKSYVAVVGAGLATVIQGNISSATENATAALVSCPDNGSISSLYIRNNGGGVGPYAIGLFNVGECIVNDVDIIVEGSDRNYGVYNYSSFPSLYDVSIKSVGGLTAAGIYNNNSSLFAFDVFSRGEDGFESEGLINAYGATAAVSNCSFEGSATFGYGIYNVGADITIRNSHVEGSFRGFYLNGGTVKILNSSLVGIPLFDGSGTYTCLQSNNGATAELGINCL